MPLFDLDQESVNPLLARTGALEAGQLDREQAKADEAAPQRSFIEVATTPMPWMPALRQNNTIASMLSRQDLGVDNSVDPAHDPWKEIQGTKYEAYWDSFAGSMNPRHTDALKRQIDMEENDKRDLASAGWAGTLASIASGAVDWPTLIPGGGLVRSIKGGWSVSKTALMTGGSAAASTAAQEAMLHQSQETRTWEESGLNIGSAAVLGSLVGGGAAGLLSRAEVTSASKALKDLEAAKEPTLADINEPLTAADLSAARADKPTLEDLSVSGTAAGAVARATKLLNPNLRQNFSLVPQAREIAQMLSENTLYQNMHDEGRTLGYSAETMMRVEMQGRTAAALSAHNDFFAQMRKEGVKMSQGEFEDAVGRAMRRGDEDPGNPYVTQAAKAWRQKLYEPFLKDAIDSGLLPADVSVETAPSYFSRVYNPDLIRSEAPQFKQVVSEHYAALAEQEHAQAKESVVKRTLRLDREIRDLQLEPDMRVATMKGLEGLGDRLDARYSDARDTYSDIVDSRRAYRDAREAGNAPEMERLSAHIDRLREKGGKDLRSYLEQRTELRRRMRNVDLGYSGMMTRVDQAVNSLANVETTNERQMQRLVARGQQLQKDIVRLDPAKREARLSELRSSFTDVASRMDKAAERARTQLQKLKEQKAGEESSGLPETVSGEMSARFEAWAAANEKKAAQLNSIANRLERWEEFDPVATLKELRDNLDEAVGEASTRALMRGEKSQRLKDRIASLDPKKVADKIAAAKETQAQLKRDFYDRWGLQKGGENVDIDAVGAPNFKTLGDEVADQVYSKLTGDQYDGPTHPEFYTPISRGVFKDRTFNIPDAKIERWLEDNVAHVSRRYARQMAGEINLTRKFGRADMRDQFVELSAGYKDLEDQVHAKNLPEKERNSELAAIKSDKARAVNDLGALRDLVRGTYQKGLQSESARNVSQALMTYNYIRAMGNFMISSVSQIYRPAMVHGLMPFMGEAVVPLLKSLAKHEGLWTKNADEAAAAGVAVDHVIGSRLASFSEIGDPYAKGTAFQRLLDNGARIATKWNGLAAMDDATRRVGSMMTTNRILKAAEKGGDARYLAYLGIDQRTANAIAEQFAKHGETIEGVRVANSEAWDIGPQRAFRAALNKDVSTLIDKSVGDVPLFAHTPTGRVLLQFQTFNMAAHQRTMLRGLQESPTNFMSGLVAMTGFGMLSAYLTALRGGSERFEKFKQDIEKQPGLWVAQGLERSGIFPLLFEAANHVEHVAQPAGFAFNPIKTPMAAIGAQAGAERRIGQAQDPLGSLLGPSASLPYALAQAAGGAINLARGETTKKQQAKAAIGLVPYANYFGMREVLQLMTGDSPYVGSQ